MSTSLIVNTDISASAAITDTKLATISTAGKVANSATTATSANTTNTIVARDASGNFSATTITASLSGNASSATTATNISGGTQGSIPVQLAAGTTSLLAKGGAGQVLKMSPAGNPEWSMFENSVTSVAGRTGAVMLNKGDVGLGNVENTALSSWPGSPAIDRVGTVTMGKWEAAPLEIEHGGTGATAKAEAFNALSPMTSEGDIIYGGADGTATRLEKGSAGQVLMMNEWETAPEWSSPTAQALVMTQSELLSIGNPAEGLMVFCTDCGVAGAQCIFAANTWNYLLVSSSSQSPATPKADEISYLENGLRWRCRSVQGADSYKWNVSSDYSTAFTTSPEREYDQAGTECERSYICYVWACYNSGLVSAPLELYEWVEAPEVPEIGKTELVEEDQILWKWHRVNTALGYRFGSSNDISLSDDVGISCNNSETVPSQGLYTRYVWAYNSCGHSDSLVLLFRPDLSAPIADDAVRISDTLLWKWKEVQNASEYKWSTNNDYSTAINIGDSTQIGELGLTCGTFYTRYVWASNLWGHSDSLVLYDAPGPPTSPVLIDGGH